MEKDYIGFEDIKSLLHIPDVSLFQVYLREVYKDLSDRAESNRKQGISKITFMEYMKLPVFICEKLFAALDVDNDQFLSIKEFTEGLFNLYNGNFEETSDLIFKMIDFNKDGLISKGDMKILLSYIPVKNQNVSEYMYQLECLDEIEEIIKETFGNNQTLTYTEFLNHTQHKKSDVYVQLLCFLYVFKPFTENNIKTYQSFKKRSDSQSSSPSGKVSEVKMPSPSRNSRLLPAEILNIQLDESMSATDSPRKDLSPYKKSVKINPMDLFVRMSNTRVVDKKDSINNMKIEELIKTSKNVYDSPTRYITKKDPKVSEFNLEDNLIELDLDDNKDEVDIINENWVYKLTETNKLKKYWIALIGKDIYYYKSDKKEDLQGMHNLSGCFIKENSEKLIDGQTYYSFSVIFSSKTRNYYTTNRDEMKKWISCLKDAIGYQSFFDFYTLSDDIGEGKFGVVKLGIHKKTDEKVAIKIIKKTAMTLADMELVRSEMDIMKLCKHPNIVRLLDHFENSEYIFLVMEYLQGGDFGNFLKKNHYKFQENAASKIMYQIGLGIKYLHEYGVLHRDLKPENIMLAEYSNDPIMKIMDFGLSKILGPQEKAVDGYGTLSYVAPEVLIRQPYNKQIDIWSMGIILFYMLSGLLPFDDEDDNEEIIAKRVVFMELEFPDKAFKNKSPEVKDLISKCLIKDPNARIIVEEFLNHQWIKKYNS
jgi:hypothetical protein